MTDDLTLNMDAYLPLRDVVFNTLREAILKGDLKPGERLMELQLAAKLGVSRTPIREAIRMLEQEGFRRLHQPGGGGREVPRYHLRGYGQSTPDQYSEQSAGADLPVPCGIYQKSGQLSDPDCGT